MILTGKALQDFTKWIFEKYGITYTELYEKVYLNALIIEWFDSVRIILNIGGVLNNGIYRFDFDIQQNNTLNGCGSDIFTCRQEATNAAIEKANEIYNGI